MSFVVKHAATPIEPKFSAASVLGLRIPMQNGLCAPLPQVKLALRDDFDFGQNAQVWNWARGQPVGSALANRVKAAPFASIANPVPLAPMGRASASCTRQRAEADTEHRLASLRGARFGWTRMSNGQPKAHAGVDLFAVVGTPIFAMEDSRIVVLGHQNGYGNVIGLEFTPRGGAEAALAAHGGKGMKWIIFYAHMEGLPSKWQVNQEVSKGSVVGTVGLSGGVNPKYPHLHLELRRAGVPLGGGLTGRFEPELLFPELSALHGIDPSRYRAPVTQETGGLPTMPEIEAAGRRSGLV